jgi:hypothetical protein
MKREKEGERGKKREKEGKRRNVWRVESKDPCPAYLQPLLFQSSESRRVAPCEDGGQGCRADCTTTKLSLLFINYQ